jgi:hypothetical protein
MAGPSLVSALFGSTGSNLRNKILPQTLSSTTETEFGIGNDSNATIIAMLSVPTQTKILGAQTPTDLTQNPAVLSSGFNRIGYSGDANPYNAQMFDGCKPVASGPGRSVRAAACIVRFLQSMVITIYPVKSSDG